MEMCNKNSQQFKTLFERADISYDRFIRTTDGDHAKAVRAFWHKIESQIEKGGHTGYYSVNEETFLLEKDLERVGDQMVTNVGEVCELVTEENYVFNASD